MAMKYLAQNQHSKVKAVVSVANPWDVFRAAEKLNQKRNFIYAHFLTQKLVSKVELNLEYLKEIEKSHNIQIDLKKLKRSWNTF